MRRYPRSRWLALLQILGLPLLALTISAAYWRAGPASLDAADNDPAVGVAAAETASSTATDQATIAVLLASSTPDITPTPAPTQTTTPTPTSTPRPTFTRTSTPKPTHQPTHTPAPSDTPPPTPTATFTSTSTPTPPQPTPDGVQRKTRVPILMYHHIAKAPKKADAVRRDLSVSPQAFRQQLNYLRQAGYETITLQDLALHLTIGSPLPPKPIILTFDDGYVDNYTNAFPLLKEYGFTGTFFLTTAPMDNHNPEWLSWAQVEEMHAAGMSFEPHSYNHPDMRKRDFDFLVFQILAPKEAIEARTGETCRFFAYPSGRYDDYVIEVLRSADFWGAVLVEQGATHTDSDLFTLKRVRIQGEDDLDRFIRKLNLDW